MVPNPDGRYTKEEMRDIVNAHALAIRLEAIERLIRHELCHVRQWWRYGIIGFAVLYLYYIYKYGYWFNPFEIEARENER